MIEARYYLDRKNLTRKIVYIEPERERCYKIESPTLGLGLVCHIIYYDIDPKTGNRTGHYYRSSDLFKTEKECNVALRNQIKENIRNCRKKIYIYEKQYKNWNL